jgi:FkbM family methyltransferase
MFKKILDALADTPAHHSYASSLYELLNMMSKRELATSGFQLETNRVLFGHFGEISFPYKKMGAVDTLNLFGLDELIIFSYYWVNRDRYVRAADIGANLGLHSIIMSRCGWEVLAFEPDPTHASLLRDNLKSNDIKNVIVDQAAVSDKAGVLEFVRVLGNTTGSHLAGAKPNPYGNLERFPVNVRSICDIMLAVDFIKLDVEGQEKVILLTTEAIHWVKTDMILEIGSKENAAAIFDHMKNIGVNIFSQKIGWRKVEFVGQMPINYAEGSCFISIKSEMLWG